MYVKSTNISKPKTILWHNTQVSTGIFKTPVAKAIFLGKNGIINDYVADKKYMAALIRRVICFRQIITHTGKKCTLI